MKLYLSYGLSLNYIFVYRALSSQANKDIFSNFSRFYFVLRNLIRNAILVSFLRLWFVLSLISWGRHLRLLQLAAAWKSALLPCDSRHSLKRTWKSAVQVKVLIRILSVLFGVIILLEHSFSSICDSVIISSEPSWNGSTQALSLIIFLLLLNRLGFESVSAVCHFYGLLSSSSSLSSGPSSAHRTLATADWAHKSWEQYYCCCCQANQK